MLFPCQLEIDHVTQKPKETCQSTCRGPRFKAIETKSVSDADCMKLLTPGPEILMERFRDVACSTGSNTQGTMPTVTSQFLSRYTVRIVMNALMNSTVQH